MSPVFRALLWAIPSFAVALGWIADLIPSPLASTLLLVLPIVMLATTPRAVCRKA
ncbi:hypothetical protein [Sphingopyxis sp. PAMC25046]|uniref:hypothetical protein n=1 Tax=Sphingopyxis sp. PAMC25046 TaxID=2565556 RepID=UPI001447D1D7|nr:hypothetical protein [Sphingopyxis sp. PAMC25046]